jgi:hypothetical protein
MNEQWLTHKFQVYNCNICNSQTVDCSKICWTCRTTPMCRLWPKVSNVKRLKIDNDYGYRGVSLLKLCTNRTFNKFSILSQTFWGCFISDNKPYPISFLGWPHLNTCLIISQSNDSRWLSGITFVAAGGCGMDFGFVLFEGDALDPRDDPPCIPCAVHNKIFERTYMHVCMDQVSLISAISQTGCSLFCLFSY